MESLEVALQPDASQVRAARAHVAAACKGMQRDLLEIAQLLTSELVSNAVQHGSGAIRLRVTTLPHRLRVAVSDEGERRVAPRAAPDDQAGGRGLLILERLAADWGVEQFTDRPGKTVWFVLRTA